MRLIAIAFFLFFNEYGFSQQAAVELERNDWLYEGIKAPVTVAVSNCDCKDVSVTMTNGTLTGSGCEYFFTPGKAGLSPVITVYRKKQNKKIPFYQRTFRIKGIPKPAFCIGGCCSDKKFTQENKTLKYELASQQFTRADLHADIGFDIRYIVDSFYVKIFNADSCKPVIYKNTSNKVSEEIRNAFKALPEESIVIFYKIYATGPGLINGELDPLVLIIKQ